MEVFEGDLCSLRNINATYKVKRTATAEKASEVEERKKTREDAKTTAVQEAEQLVLDFERCRGEKGCVCGVVPCPVAHLKRCVTCKAIKPGKQAYAK